VRGVAHWQGRRCGCRALLALAALTAIGYDVAAGPGVSGTLVGVPNEQPATLHEHQVILQQLAEPIDRP
jgi:hypothetical protein